MKSAQQLLYDVKKYDVTNNFLVSEGHWKGQLKDNKFWEVLQGSSKETLLKLEPNSFDCVVTSPPYFWLRDYGVENQIGQEETVKEYVKAISSVMDEVFRVLKPTGLLFLNLSDTYYSGKGKPKYPDQKSKKRRFGLRAVDKSGGLDIGIQRKSMIGIPWRVAIEMTKTNWVLRSTIIWHRDKALPERVKDRPKRSYEYIFMFSKDRYYHFDPEPLAETNYDQDVWTIPARPKSNGIDTAPYPDDLVKKCLEIGCIEGGTVLDPFAGSGTTLRVAAELGHSAVGIDLNKEFCEYMVKELSAISVVNE